MILEIKDTIENIIEMVNKFNDVSLESLAEEMNTFQDFMDLLEEFGINEKSNIITLKDAIENGINVFKNNMDNLKA